MYFMVNSSKGVSSVFLAKWIGVRQKTAWKVGHAIRAMMKAHGKAIAPLDGIVELDEKYLRGKHDLNMVLFTQEAKTPTKVAFMLPSSTMVKLKLKSSTVIVMPTWHREWLQLFHQMRML